MLVRMKSVLTAALAALAMLATSADSRAELILVFGQAGIGSPIVGTNNGANPATTTITATGAEIVITALSPTAGLTTPLVAYLNMTTTSITQAVLVGGEIKQKFAGSLSITSNADGSGINYLSAVFTDSVFGSGTGLTMTASDADGVSAVVFTSDVFPAANLNAPRALSLAFTNVMPAASIVNGSLASFSSNVAGAFSASVPEPASVISLATGLGLCGGVMALRRRRGC